MLTSELGNYMWHSSLKREQRGWKRQDSTAPGNRQKITSAYLSALGCLVVSSSDVGVHGSLAVVCITVPAIAIEANIQHNEGSYQNHYWLSTWCHTTSSLWTGCGTRTVIVGSLQSTDGIKVTGWAREGGEEKYWFVRRQTLVYGSSQC